MTLSTRSHAALAAVTLSLAFAPVACDDDDDGGGGGGPTGGSGPSLAAADRPSESPCPDQDVLTDTDEFDDFLEALEMGSFVYLDLPYNASDPNIFAKKCGLGSAWDPSDNTDEIPPVSTPVTISQLFTSGNAGICADGFTSGDFGTGEGYPAAGTYRKEFKVTFSGMTWHVRVRITASGTAAGETFASRGITVPTDIEDTLVYEVDGAETDHDDVLLEAIGSLQASSSGSTPNVMIEVRESAAGAVVFTLLVEIICVSKS